MRSRALVAALLSTVVAARARAVERVEQGPAGVATAGAETADADDAAAVYYNPAVLVFQRGFSAQAGADVTYRDGVATTASGDSRDDSYFASPAVFVGQRIGNRYAVGIGVYEPFAWTSSYAGDWPGAPVGTSLTLHTWAVNPSVAIRPLRWLAIGFGVDIVPTSFDFASTSFFVHSHGVGAGGNAAIFARIVPRWLDAGFAYRSAVDVELPANGSSPTLSLPHQLSWGLASHPLRGMTVTADVRFVIWQDLTRVVWKQPDGTSAGLVLDFQNTVGVRIGVQYRLRRDRLVARVGGGWEQSPASAANTEPVLAVGDRGLVGAGVGGTWRWLSVDAGYLAIIGGEFTGARDNFVARYRFVSHTASVALTLRLPDGPWRARPTDPAY